MSMLDECFGDYKLIDARWLNNRSEPPNRKTHKPGIKGFSIAFIQLSKQLSNCDCPTELRPKRRGLFARKLRMLFREVGFFQRTSRNAVTTRQRLSGSKDSR